MATSVTINGQVYAQPDQGTPPPWGDIQATIVAALASSTLQKNGGSFTLTADVNFGATYGLISTYFKSRTADIATTGILRLANADVIGWRNAANDGNLTLAPNGSDHLVFAGKDLTPMTTDGDMVYQASSVPARLPVGTNGQVLAVVGGAPAWSSAPGSGDVSGPASSTDNEIAIFNGTTGKIIKNSSILVTNVVIGPASATDGYVPLFDGTTGKLLKNSTLNPSTIVIGPSSATDNAIPRYDGTTGKLIQDSGVTIDDSQNIDGVGDLTASGTLDATGVSSALASAVIGFSPMAWSSYTPTVTSTTGGDTIPNYTTNSGAYFRIGDLVFLKVSLSRSGGGTAGSGAGVLQVSLPYTHAMTSASVIFCPCGLMTNGSTQNLIYADINNNASVVAFSRLTGASTTAVLTPSDQNNSTRRIQFQLFYQAAPL